MNLKRLALEELARRALAKRKTYSLRDEKFHRQNQFLDDRDKNRFRAVNCTRRAGKSIGNVIDDVEICNKYPGSKIITGGLTLGSIVNIAWDEYLNLDDKHKIGIRPNKAERTLTFPNGSKIQLFGVDSSEKQMRKTLGQKLRKASFDECGSMTVNMKRLCYQMVLPALTDLSPFSWMSLLGTCENIPKTFFEGVTEGRDNFLPWSVHKWTAYDNPHMKEQWSREIEEMVKRNPDIINTSIFKTHYLNQWCTDDSLQIIPFKQSYVGEMPNLTFQYILGIDLGSNDDTSFALIATNHHHPTAYIAKTFKKPGLDFTDTANIIKQYQKDFDIMAMQIDGANKQGVEELRNRHSLPLEAAHKSPGYKPILLRQLKDDFIQGRVKACAGTEDLQQEYHQLQWKDETHKEEDPRCANHLSDAVLYAWQKARHYIYQEPEHKLDVNSEEYMLKLEREEAAKLTEGDEWWR
jgi:hypothetical protein